MNWIDVYAEARVAFVDYPDVRISTVADACQRTTWLCARGTIDGRAYAIDWWVPDYVGVIDAQRLAENAAERWRHAILDNERWIEFDPDVVEDYLHRLGLRLRVNEAWGSHRRMRFEKDRVLVVSPAVYEELARDYGRYMMHVGCRVDPSLDALYRV